MVVVGVVLLEVKGGPLQELVAILVTVGVCAPRDELLADEVVHVSPCLV
jgi:hypothetical protein